MIILLREKNLIITKRSQIYKYETGIDEIRFYIPTTYNGIDFSVLNCVVEMERPYVDRGTTSTSTYTNSDGEVMEKIYKYFPYDESEEYAKDGYLSIVIPITTAITMKEGTITLWLKFMKPEDYSSSIAEYVFASNSVSFSIEINKSYTESGKDEFDEVWEHTNLDSVYEKMNGLIDYEYDDEEVSDDGTN